MTDWVSTACYLYKARLKLEHALYLTAKPQLEPPDGVLPKNLAILRTIENILVRWPSFMSVKQIWMLGMEVRGPLASCLLSTLCH
jgi:hypothetical protein